MYKPARLHFQLSCDRSRLLERLGSHFHIIRTVQININNWKDTKRVGRRREGKKKEKHYLESLLSPDPVEPVEDLRPGTRLCVRVMCPREVFLRIVRSRNCLLNGVLL